MKRILAFLLIGMLFVLSLGCITVSGLSCSAPIRYANADKYTAGDFTYESDKVKKVEIEWVNGSVTLINGTGTLSVSEKSADALGEEDQMHWWLDGTTLRIRFCKSGKKLKVNEGKKDLTVELPASADLKIEIASGKIISEKPLDLGTFKLQTASGGTSIGSLSAKEVKIESASGGLLMGKVSVAGTFKVETASGGLSVDEISAEEIRIESASGGIALGLDAVETVDLQSASGSIRLKLLSPENGANVEYSAVSGSMNCKLPFEKDGSDYRIGLGAIRIKIEVVSGSVTIE